MRGVRSGKAIGKVSHVAEFKRELPEAADWSSIYGESRGEYSEFRAGGPDLGGRKNRAGVQATGRSGNR